MDREADREEKKRHEQEKSIMNVERKTMNNPSYINLVNVNGPIPGQKQNTRQQKKNLWYTKFQDPYIECVEE